MTSGPVVTDKQVGEAVKRWRRALGYTQDDVAAALGIPRPAVTKVESGRRRLLFTESIRLCQWLGIPVDALNEHPAELLRNAARTRTTAR